MIKKQGEAIKCPHCQVGIMKQKQLTYFTWLNNELITVPEFPSWVCDFCRYREYDKKALNRLDNLMYSIKKEQTVKFHPHVHSVDESPTAPTAGIE